MAIGTIGSFAIIVLANQNAATDTARFNELQAEFQKSYEDYQAKTEAQATELSAEYFDKFNKYSGRPAAFDAASVTELGKNDLEVGTGEAITSESTFSAYYLGWNPSGKVFDGSIDGDALKAPINVTPGGVIEGWTQGVDGMKVGGVRELSIPSALAYGETGSGEDIPANTPIKFVIMIIPEQETIPQPSYSQEYIQLYTRLYGNGQ